MLSFHITTSHIHILRSGRLIGMTQYSFGEKKNLQLGVWQNSNAALVWSNSQMFN